MKYFTKEWYHKMQRTGLHLILKIDERCSEYSDELYKELYDLEKNKFLKMMSFCLDYNVFCDVLKTVDENYENLSEEEKKAKFEEMRYDTLGDMTLEERFDYDKEQFILDIKEKIDSKILDEIADMRVFSLGYTTEEIYKKIEKISNANGEFVNEKLKEYWDYENKHINDDISLLAEHLHDGNIISTETVDNNFCINMETDAGDQKKIIFKNFEIVLDEGIDMSDWLYHEIYKVDGGLEVHILVGHGELKELIIRCSEVIVE